IDGGDARQLTNDEPEDTTPLWHPDGKRIIYNSERNGVIQIYSVPADGGSPKPVTLSDNNNYVSDISPDGQRLIYTSTRNDSDLWALSAENGQESQITTDLGV